MKCVLLQKYNGLLSLPTIASGCIELDDDEHGTFDLLQCNAFSQRFKHKSLAPTFSVLRSYFTRVFLDDIQCIEERIEMQGCKPRSKQATYFIAAPTAAGPPAKYPCNRLGSNFATMINADEAYIHGRQQ
eukprot:TRINITY_DN12447_c0_g2_i9.p3 TRINITY_DN12447_c0_g2~~TRINITY_DN12447_c0_g2_i9.p3  ORF type:complete len:130 (+),score=3.24 TRINITY_DN12447_c0_g2_i9:144-533(+)